VEKACPAAGLTVARFIPEYYGERTENGGMRRLITDSAPDADKPGQKVWFTPDAMFILDRAGKQALFFLETDRGTEKIASGRYPAFTNKIMAYMNYFRTDGFRRWGEQFKGFRALVVTSSVERQENLLLAAKKVGVQRLMWFTTHAQVTTGTVLTSIWRIPGPDDQCRRLQALSESAINATHIHDAH
jgi:hypothetical protein